jgi:hypothetical protein
MYRGMLVVLVCLALTAPIYSQEDVSGLLDRALKAHGGEAALARFKARHFKVQGKLIAQNLPFTQELLFQSPGQAREVLSVEAEGKKSVIVYTLSNGQGWIQVDGKTQAMPEAMLTELQEATHFARIAGLSGLKDAGKQASALPPTEIGGRTALGVKLAVRGFRDVNLYFDKQTAFLLKAEHQVMDTAARQLILEERYYSAWKDVNGLKLPSHVEVLRDGKRFMAADAVEMQALERLDDTLFAKP